MKKGHPTGASSGDHTQAASLPSGIAALKPPPTRRRATTPPTYPLMVGKHPELSLRRCSPIVTAAAPSWPLRGGMTSERPQPQQHLEARAAPVI